MFFFGLNSLSLDAKVQGKAKFVSPCALNPCLANQAAKSVESSNLLRSSPKYKLFKFLSRKGGTTPKS